MSCLQKLHCSHHKTKDWREAKDQRSNNSRVKTALRSRWVWSGRLTVEDSDPTWICDWRQVIFDLYTSWLVFDLCLPKKYFLGIQPPRDLCVCRKEERKAGGYESESLFTFPIVGKVNGRGRKDGMIDRNFLPWLKLHRIDHSNLYNSFPCPSHKVPSPLSFPRSFLY